RAAVMPDCRHSAGESPTRPATPITRAEAAARPATDAPTFPPRAWHSHEPSPASTHSAYDRAAVRPTAPAPLDLPGTTSAPNRVESVSGIPPAAPNPGVVAKVSASAADPASTTARWPSPVSSTVTDSGSAPFCGPKTAAAPRG